jgi:uncharacterized membrane protein
MPKFGPIAWRLDVRFFSFLIAIVALIVAAKAFNQIAALRQRIDALERTASQMQAAPPPLAPYLKADQALPASSPDIAAEQPSPVAEVEPVAPMAESPETAPELDAGDAAPPPLPQLNPTPSFEERIGTRWVVWVGGLTLALGGFFMVRYSIEAGLVGPGVRTLLGGAFALALLAAGEWMRRKESVSTIEALPIANIPAILTAAGTSVAFATVYAAYALYGFLAPATAFILLGLVALGTLAAALLHGPALAGLGVAAAFATPILVSSDKPDFWALYIYLAIVTAAAFALARIRLWRWLAVTTIVFALLRTFPCLECEAPMVGAHVFHVIGGFILAALLVVCGFMFGPPAEEGRIEPISSGALAAYLFGAMAIEITSLHADTAMTGFALMVAGTLLIAWRAPAATGALAAAAVFAAFVFLEWAVLANPDMLVVPGGALPGIGPHATDGSVSLHLVSAAILAAGFGIAGFLAQGRSTNAIIPVVWSGAAVFTPLALMIALYARIAHLDQSIPFAILAVVLAAAFGAATEILGKRDDRPGLPIAVALFATGTLSALALALALTFALDKGLLSIAIALMSLGTAWVSMQRPIPFLRSLAAILAGIVVMRTAYEPRIAGDAIGTTPIFNWLLWGYGVPALSFWAGSIFLRRRGDDPPQRAVESAAILFTVLLVFHQNSPCGERRRHLSRYRRPGRSGVSGVHGARDGDRAGATADPHRQRHSQCQCGAANDLCRPWHLVGPDAVGIADIMGDQCRRRVHQPAFARLRLARGARAIVVLCGSRPPQRGLRQHDRRRRADSGVELSQLRNSQALSRPAPDHRRHQWRRAIHLFDCLAGVRRRVARHRHRLQFAARPARFRGGDRADDYEGVPR